MNIDELSIQISASATNVDSKIDALIKQLGRLQGALDVKVNNNLSNSLKTLSGSLSEFSTSLDSIDSGELKNLSSALNSFANSTGKLDQLGSKFAELGNPFNSIVESLRSLEGVSVNAENLSGLSVLAGYMGKLGGIASERASTSLRGIADGIRAFEGLPIPSLDGMEEFSNALHRLGSGKSLVKAGQSLPAIADGLRSLEGLHFSNAEEIEKMAHAISRFGLSNSQKAIESLPKLADSFKRFATTLSSMPTVSQNTIDLANAMANLAAQGGKANSAVSALTPRMNAWSKTAHSASRRSFSLAAAIGKVYATYWLLFRAFGKVKEAIDLSAALTEVQNVVNHTFGDMTYKVEEFAEKSIQSFGMAELQAKQVSSRFQAMGSAMGITGSQVKKATENFGEFNKTLSAADYNGVADSMADVSLNLTKLTADFASFYNMDIDEVATKMESVFTGQTRPLRTFGLDLTEVSLKEYALSKGIDANIKSMTQAEKTMLRYQYVMEHADASIGDFARTMNTWANVVRTIGQQFQKLGSMIGGGLINIFKPVLIRIRDFLNTMIGLVEKAINAIGKLLGWQIEIEEVGTTFDDAADGAEGMADGLGGAAKNAKELNKQIRGWDKLNVLNSNNGSGGGGSGGGGASGGGAGAGKTTGGNLSVKQYESDINSWFELGERIGDKIKDALSNIDWDSVFQGAKDFGKNLASFLNGLISPELFYQVGRTIANSLNTVLYSALSFGEEFDFIDFGKSIANGINGFFENFDFKALANTIDVWVQGIWDTLKSCIENLNWGAIWNGIKDFVSELDLDTISILIGGIGSIWWLKQGTKLTGSLLMSALTEKITGMLAGTGISAGLAGGMIVLDIAAIVTTTFLFGKDLKDWIDSIKEYGWDEGRKKRASSKKENTKDTPANFGIKAPWDKNSEATKTARNGVQWDEKQLWNTEANFVDNYLKNLSKAMDGLNKSAGDSKGIKWFKDLAANVVLCPPVIASFGGSVNGATDDLSDFDAQADDTDKTASDVFSSDKWSTYGKNMYDGIHDKWEELKKWWENSAIVQWWRNFKSNFTKDKFKSNIGSVKTALEERWNELKNWWDQTALVQWWNKFKTNFTKDKFKENIGSVKTALDERWAELKNWWDQTALVQWWNNFKTNFSKDKFKENFGSIRDSLSEKWEEARSWWDNSKTSLSEIKFSIQDLFSKVKDAWNNAKTWISNHTNLGSLGFTIKTPHFNWSSTGGGTATGTVYKILQALGLPTSLPKLTVSWYKKGGFLDDIPSQFSLYGMGENGVPEMLGSVGGKPAVAGGDEITGIREAVENSSNQEMALLREEIRLLKTIAAKDVSISSRDIFAATQSEARGYVRRTGNPAFA